MPIQSRKTRRNRKRNNKSRRTLKNKTTRKTTRRYKKQMKGGDKEFTNFKSLKAYWNKKPILSKNSHWYLITENNMSLPYGQITSYNNLREKIKKYLKNRNIDELSSNGIRVGVQLDFPFDYVTESEDDGNSTDEDGNSSDEEH